MEKFKLYYSNDFVICRLTYDKCNSINCCLYRLHARASVLCILQKLPGIYNNIRDQVGNLNEALKT